MTKGQFKDLVSHMCLAGAVVASWFLTQEVVGSNPFTIMTNLFVTEFAKFGSLFADSDHCTILPGQ